ncbi:MAG TPA: endonuclease domain-containing protein [Devosia sp.]|jgi:very-short-patch-repair endonuclease|uniref:endonuclease domain-containing protein n=1 Tax=Devosia sp. TaxID=1871048 RepID=UPI002F927A5E
MSVERARQLRKTMSVPEAKLWNALRELRPMGHHFRRQVQISYFYADFCCHKHRLIIEVDGDTHFEDGSIADDARRDQLLGREGYRVLRVSNRDVMRNMDGVLTLVLQALDRPPPSFPPHKGEGSSPGALGDV